MWESRAEKQFVDLRQKQGRNPQSERSADTLSKEHLSKEVMYITYMGQCFWVFVSVWSIILFSFFTSDWS